MGAEYQEHSYISQVPVLKTTGERDLGWLSGDLSSIEWKDQPDQQIRMLDHWDNGNGTVERGYAGRSIFFEGSDSEAEGFRKDWKLVEEYAQLLESIRINAVCINNVNVREKARWLITNTDDNFNNLGRIADIFRSRGIKLFIAINFAAPKIVGDLDTSDPLSPQVAKFWQQRAADIYQHIPDFGGFVVKADSEGEPGPYAYGRNHADGANMLGKAVEPYGGIIIWRAFVYNHHEDWRAVGDYKVDRTMAAFNNFYPHDGEFADNVILQVKYGPTDFQIKEPITPLIGKMTRTNQIVEFQITQEYTGQQQHICYLAPVWTEVLAAKMGADDETVSNIIPTYSPSSQRSGVAAVANIGTDANWTGHKLAQANLYAYGRLAWDNSLSAEQIGREWVNLTFPKLDADAQAVIYNILITSRDTYRNYTSPLGLPEAMARAGFHYGPYPESYEYDRWGIYKFPDRDGFGHNRTMSGSGFTGQYHPNVAARYEDINDCPDDLVAFFHHVPYNHILHCGKTVIQHIYDTRFDGVEQVEQYIQSIEALKSAFEQAGYAEHWENIRTRLDEQLSCATDWRDFTNTYFHRFAGVGDDKGRKIFR
jgi:alpha-glucuronidase